MKSNRDTQRAIFCPDTILTASSGISYTEIGLQLMAAASWSEDCLWLESSCGLLAIRATNGRRLVQITCDF